MTIIEDIFSKRNNITENDLNNIIGRCKETSEIECKIETNSNINNSKNTKDLYPIVVKTVIGFLNKPENDSAGLLMIGMNAPNGVINQVVPIKRNYLKQNVLRNKLAEDIRSIPSVHRSYSLEVIEVPVTGGYVTLVEVHKTDPNAVFYWKSGNSAYIRQSDTTKTWDLGDMFKVALTKNYPIVYPVFRLNPKIQVSVNLTKYTIDTIIKNDGTSPGRDVIVFLKFKDPTKGKLSLWDLKGFYDLQADPPFSMKLESDLFLPNNKPLYPSLELQFGSFAVTLVNGGSLEIDAVTYENRGITTNKFILANNKIQSDPPIFVPYLH